MGWDGVRFGGIECFFLFWLWSSVYVGLSCVYVCMCGSVSLIETSNRNLIPQRVNPSIHRVMYLHRTGPTNQRTSPPFRRKFHWVLDVQTRRRSIASSVMSALPMIWRCRRSAAPLFPVRGRFRLYASELKSHTCSSNLAMCGGGGGGYVYLLVFFC